MHPKQPSDAMSFSLLALAQAPLENDEKEFIRGYFEVPWVIDALVAYPIAHFTHLLCSKDIDRATEEMVAWAEVTEMFPPEVDPRVQKNFLCLVVIAAIRIVQTREVHRWS
jgi:hypothetical protein